MRERIAAKLRQAAEDPAHHLSRLSSVEAYKLRVGDYRVIIDADWGGKILQVVALGHRITSYR